jgi:hypothetical protein
MSREGFKPESAGHNASIKPSALMALLFAYPNDYPNRVLSQGIASARIIETTIRGGLSPSRRVVQFHVAQKRL